IIVALVLVITLGTPGGASASKPSRNNRAKITDGSDLSALCERIKANLEESHLAASFPGATVGFVLADGRSGSVSVGLADVEKKILLKPSDRMLAGSIGKTYVSAVMLQLVEEEKINLETKIERWFGGDAWFPRLPNAKDITLRMLMNHSSGIP